MKRPRVRHSTVPTTLPPRTPKPPRPPAAPAGVDAAAAAAGAPPHRSHRPSSDTSLLDVIDSLLNKGVVLNADIILALANVDLVYLRLSALLCAADRVFARR